MKNNVLLTPTGILKALFWLRNFAIVGQATVVALTNWGLSLNLPLEPLFSIIASLALWNVAVYWRLGKPWIVTPLEVLLNLAIDATVLTLLLYWAGGATNPFVSLYLVPIAIASAALPARYILAVSLLCIVYYSLLMLFYTPLPPVHERFGGDFNLHIFGMWVNFLVSAALMAVVVAGIAGAVRRRDRSLAEARETALRNEQIVAMGTLSAGVAHEISSPLSTMTIVVDELLDQRDGDPEVRGDLEVLKSQIGVCKDRIKDLLDTAGHTRSEGGQAMPLHQFCERLLDNWRMVRPEIELDTHYEEPFDNPTILAEQTIAQSITNLLNNAGDASLENESHWVAVSISSLEDRLVIFIDDDGKGITTEQMEKAGQAFFSSKPTGLGIGLVLSNASLGRFGGEISLGNCAGHGTRTEIRLPIHELTID